MKRLLTLFTMLAVACVAVPRPVSAADASSSGEPTPPPKKDCGHVASKWQKAQCLNYNDAAPADEYFGRMKLSYIGIENTFHDMRIESGDYTTDSRIIAKLLFASDALAKWAAKYPQDPELARAFYMGVLVYQKIYTQNGQQLAWQYTQYVVHKYPHTFFGKTLANEVKGGFVEHWYADAQACPAPGADPPSPAAAPASKPGQPVVELIQPPCIQPSPATAVDPPASPAPAPVATQAPRGRRNAPAPAASGTPLPGPSPAPPA